MNDGSSAPAVPYGRGTGLPLLPDGADGVFGDPVLSPTVTRQLMRHAAGAAADDRRSRARERLAALNDREREVAVRVGRGLANAQIAAELFMSVATVKTHVSRVLARLGLNNRVQIALLAHDAGLLEQDAP